MKSAKLTNWGGGVWNKVKDRAEPTGWRRIFSRHFILPTGQEKGFDIDNHRDSSMVLAITENEEVILVKQFRPGPERMLVELPGGIVDEGEEPAVGAARELLEETGYAGELSPIDTLWLDAYSTGCKYLFLATNCKWVQEQRTDDDEFIEVILMPLEEFREWIHTESEVMDNNCAFKALKRYDDGRSKKTKI